ncbi:MAG: DEAD/DEAH box helicase [Planctomycetes bacterium]|nr:DEAD/DEAH box helicase [Planctomycetota bacterium]
MRPFDRLHPALQHHIVNSLGWRDLRPVQDVAIDAALAGENLVVIAPTAGGKTEAAFFPLISLTLERAWKPMSVLYVSPIRALLNNQEVRLARYYELLGRRVGVWHGDVGPSERRRLVREPPDCLLTTPESLEVMLVSRAVPHAQLLGAVQAVVVDEAHAFAGDDRGWHLLSLLSRISRVAGRDIQRIGLSATVGNPESLVEWLSAGSSRGRRVVRPADMASREAKVELDHVGTIANAAKVVHGLHRGEKRLVFVDSRSRVEDLAAELRRLGTRTFVSHSSLGLDERRQAERAFAEGEDCVIVATSALELGIDVGDLDRVIQVDAPATVSSFLQRMGRTGRRPGTERSCLFLATSDPALLRACALIDLWAAGYVEPAVPPPEPLHILAQQLLALALQEGGIGRREWLDWVRAVPAFAALAPEVVEEIVRWMLERGILFEDQGILGVGKEGEATYGRMNFLELFAVFTAPPLFTVIHGREDIGAVHESTFLVKTEGPVILLLGGRSWKVKHLDWARRVAYVEAATERGKSRWSGAGQMLSFEVCQAIRRIVAGDDDRTWWSQRAGKELAEVREDFAWLRRGEGAPGTLLRPAGDGVEWWTFAGGRANAVLAGALEERLGDPVKSDNFAVRLRSPGSLERMQAALADLRAQDPRALRPRIDDDALAGLKFVECLPPARAMAVLEKRLGDRDGVRRALLTLVPAP